MKYVITSSNFKMLMKKLASIIDKLSPKNSCGFDDISTKLIKQSKHIFTKPLTIIINQMLNT